MIAKHEIKLKIALFRMSDNFLWYSQTTTSSFVMVYGDDNINNNNLSKY